LASLLKQKRKTMSESTDQTADRISRVVDFKIPLTYLIGGFFYAWEP
jgi:hypothetical protein